MNLTQVLDCVSTRLLHVCTWRVLLTSCVLLVTFLYLRCLSKWASRQPQREGGQHKRAPVELDGVSMFRDNARMAKEHLREAHLGLQTLHNCDEPTIEYVRDRSDICVTLLMSP